LRREKKKIREEERDERRGGGEGREKKEEGRRKESCEILIEVVWAGCSQRMIYQFAFAFIAFIIIMM